MGSKCGHYPVKGRGLCNACYLRARRNGTPMPPVKTRSVDEWLRLIDQSDDGCWLWPGRRDTGGYGVIDTGGTSLKAHRVTYEAWVGPIPPGYTLDHRCKVRHCVRPAHLQPMPLAQNILLGDGYSGLNARKTRCIRGHEFTSENTITYPSAPRTRRCRACTRSARRAARHSTTAPSGGLQEYVGAVSSLLERVQV